MKILLAIVFFAWGCDKDPLPPPVHKQTATFTLMGSQSVRRSVVMYFQGHSFDTVVYGSFKKSFQYEVLHYDLQMIITCDSLTIDTLEIEAGENYIQQWSTCRAYDYSITLSKQ